MQSAAARPGPVPVVVLSCMGAPYGDLNLTRSLGEQGVPVIVLSEYASAPSAASRHCVQHRVVPGFTQSPERLWQALVELRRSLGVEPVVFPSADPDLAALITLAPQLPCVARSAVLDAELSAALSDKQRFHQLAHTHDLPVPRTFDLRNAPPREAVERLVANARFPLIAKPAMPTAWQHPDLPHTVSRAKALRIDDAAALAQTLSTLAPCLAQTLVQEFIPGDDDAHFDVHAYVDGQGTVRALYCGRKWRINPPHAGTGCHVESVHEPAAERAARDVLSKLGYRGLANINFKRHAVTGEFKLLEVNPRVSHWHILPTRSGANLPWVAYRDLMGDPAEPPPPYRDRLFYVNAVEDRRAFRTYRREGSLGTLTWAASWLRPGTVWQFWQASDPGPALSVWRRSLARRLRLAQD